MNIDSAPTQVFVSYSHDSETHKDLALGLADRLRHDGIDVRIDRYEQSPSQGWANWMLDRIEVAKFVLIICTEQYEKRFRGKEEIDTGKGVTWQGAIITQSIYENRCRNSKFIPVLLRSDDENFVPVPLKGGNIYKIDRDDGYQLLYRLLTNQHETPAPPIGAVVKLPIATSRSWTQQHSILHKFPEISNFDLTGLMEQCLAEIIERRGVIGLSICCGDKRFRENFCERLKKELGRSTTQIRHPIFLSPQVTSINKVVATITGYQDNLNNNHVICPVIVNTSNPNSSLVKDLWIEVQQSFQGEFKHCLTILLFGSHDCTLPSEVISLQPPQFNKVHAFQWIRDMTLALKQMQASEDWIEVGDTWKGKMLERCPCDRPDSLDVSFVYEHLDFTLSLFQQDPSLSPQAFLEYLE